MSDKNELLKKLSNRTLPKKITILAFPRENGNYLGAMDVNVTEENAGEVYDKMQTVAEESGCSWHIEEDFTGLFGNPETGYFDIVAAKDNDFEDFLAVCKSLDEMNITRKRDAGALWDAINERERQWKKEIYEKVYLPYIEENEGKNNPKAPHGYIRFILGNVWREDPLQKFGINPEEDDEMLISLVIEYLKQDLACLGNRLSIVFKGWS